MRDTLLVHLGPGFGEQRRLAYILTDSIMQPFVGKCSLFALNPLRCSQFISCEGVVIARRSIVVIVHFIVKAMVGVSGCCQFTIRTFLQLQLFLWGWRVCCQ